MARAVCAVVLLGAVACGHDDPALDAIKKVPIATADIPGFTEVQRVTRSSGTSLGMPRYAGVIRVLTGPAVVSQEDVDRVAAIAARDGWGTTQSPGGRAYHGVNTVDGIRIELLIAADSLDPGTLRVSLTALDRP